MKKLKTRVNSNNKKQITMYKIILLFAMLLFVLQSFTYSGNDEAEFQLEEEMYIDDIPFNTSGIFNLEMDSNKSDADQAFRQKMMKVKELMKVDFQLDDEEYVDDIPFETCDIVRNVSENK